MKKQHVTFIILTTIFFLGINTASAAPTILTVEGAGRQIPIAVPEICTESGERTVAQEIPRVLARDLDVSGLFRVLNPGSYVETPGKCNSKGGFAYSDWSVIGAEGLVKGTVTMNGRDVRVQLYLHDVQRQQAVLGKEYSGDLSQVPRMAHRFANEIMKFFTGEYGVFGTQIAFSTRVGRFKELAIMDMDGSNVRQLTQDRGLALSASWNPNGTELVYTSYRNKVPDLFAMDLNSKRVRQLTRGAPLDIGAEYAPQGDRILFARSTGDSSDLILINSGGAAIAAVTNSRGAIDVSPSWSPDASQVTFCSNRAGSPQIYTMNSDGSHIKRISFVTSNYCTSPVWSPKGDKIAFVCRADSGFQMFVTNSDGSDALQLTSYGSNEDPSWAPNGAFLAFASTFGKKAPFQLALIKPDGTNLRQLTNSKTDDTQPAWGPLLE